MFIDYATIIISSGKGGDGLVAFRREKYVPRGGPWGGDGGDGGNVLIRASRSLGTLTEFRRKRRFQAENGGPGGRARRTGARGEDLVIPVPVGTVVKNDQQEVLADLDHDGAEFHAARGGRGGRGNSRFATSVSQAPRRATPGKPGLTLTLTLELKLIADAGLVGYPNSGKSTLLSVVSNARPLVAEYPFSTLEPSLGVVAAPGGSSFILADIPGLIEGAHQGKGLGDRFLRHIERTRVLVHMIDISVPGAADRYRSIRKELGGYSPALLEKEEIIVAAKADLPGAGENFTRLERELAGDRRTMILVSALTRQGLAALIGEIARRLGASNASG